MVSLLGASLLLFVCFFHYSQNVQPGTPSTDAMDVVQVARRIAGDDGFSTNIVRPFVLRYVRPNADGSLPDTAHAPLYPLLAGIAMKIGAQTGPGQGVRTAALLSLIFFLTSLGTCYLLSQRLFGPSGALVACVAYALGANALVVAIEPGPITLATTLFNLLLLALVNLDTLGLTATRGGTGRAALAGALFGLMFLTIYSSLILLLPIAVYIYIVTRRSGSALIAFLAVATLVASPLLLRNMRVTEAHNPLFNARLLELVMQTSAFPGYTLYRTLGPPQTLGEYLGSGGVDQILRKVGGNVLGYYINIPYTFGILVLPLFLVAGLTRFTNPQVNRLRFLVYALLGLHILGMSLFLPFRDGLPLLTMYLPFAAIIGTTFFLNFIRARNLTSFYARAAINGWMALACVPGIVQLFPSRDRPPAVYQAFLFLNERVPEVRGAPDRVLLASEIPWEIAFRIDVPALWLPSDTSEFRAAEDRLGRNVTGILLTPALAISYGNDPEIISWRSLYLRLSSLLLTASYLSAENQKRLLSTRQPYPERIGDIFANYEPPRPLPEPQGTTYSLFWRLRPPARNQ